MKSCRLLMLILAFAAPAACAESGRALLDDFFHGLETLRADFEQVIVGPNGNVRERASGQVYLDLPDRFRWDYREPYEQIIVADGERVWVYDVLLQQVTVRDQQSAAADSPMMALADIDTLDKHFRVQELGQKGGCYWLRMYPTDGEANFEYMDVAVNAAGLQALVFTDRFGQETRIAFSNLERNAVLETDLFTFEPPPEADVIGG